MIETHDMIWYDMIWYKHGNELYGHEKGTEKDYITSGFNWSRWQRKRSRHSQRMRTPITLRIWQEANDTYMHHAAGSPDCAEFDLIKLCGISINRGYPAKRALSAMRKHGG